MEKKIDVGLNRLSLAEFEELKNLGILNEDKKLQPFVMPAFTEKNIPLKKHAVHAAQTLNEAYNYPRPSSFSRALSFIVADYKVCLISGTASVDENGESVHVGDFRAQCWRTFRNITELLKAEEMTWHDVIRTSCYLRDMSRDYKDFNEIRTAFYSWLNLEVLPASTGVQLIICREDLLVEIEAIAVTQLKK